MPAFINRIGCRFGRLTVVSRAENIGKVLYWNCLCDCGISVSVSANKLPNGHTQSCGCLQRERSSSLNIQHGQTGYPNGGKPTKEYNTWGMMLKRCRNESCADYPDYGGRGITVCERWLSFENFFADMGVAPSKQHSIDRRDNNGPYAPENCTWATPKEQRRNQRGAVFIEFDGKCLTPIEWSEVTGISNKRIYHRIKRLGWSVERALTTPTKQCRP